MYTSVSVSTVAVQRLNCAIYDWSFLLLSFLLDFFRGYVYGLATMEHRPITERSSYS